MVLLVAPNEHKVNDLDRLWRGRVPDRRDVGDHHPRGDPAALQAEPARFRRRDRAGADAIIKQMSLPPEEAQKNVAAAEQAQQQRQHSGGNPLPLIFWIMVIGFVALSHFRRGVGRRYRVAPRRHQPMGGAVGPE